MKKKRVIVFGAGNYYLEHLDLIQSTYEIIGISDNNNLLRDKYSNYVKPDEICKQDYNYILVCSIYDAEIVNQLLDLGIDKEKIRLVEQIPRERRVNYAQNDEDFVLLYLLELMDKEIKKVCYLELGTNHPIRINNTYMLYTLGARGYLVEPNRSLRNIIELFRPQDHLINKAVTLDGKTREFIEFRYSPVSTLSLERLDRDYCDKEKDFQIRNTYMVESITIEGLLNIMQRVPDVLSIDVEGMDYDILSQLDYHNQRPAIIVAELNARGQLEQDGEKICSLLKENRYTLFHKNSTNGVFYDNIAFPSIEKNNC